MHPQGLVSRLGVTVVQSTLDRFGQITLCEISRGLKCFHVYPGHVQVRERNEKLRLPCFWRAPTATERRKGRLNLARAERLDSRCFSRKGSL